MNLHDVIISPVVTEKTEEIKSAGKNQNRYTFKIQMKANKELVRQALHKIYKVDAVRINTMVVPGKKKRFGQQPTKSPVWKKAMVTLAPGQKIEYS